jgi:hypothetical protein
MNLSVVGGAAAPLLRPQEKPRTTTVEQERASTAATASAPARVAASGLLAPRQGVVAPEAPAGTDPELWKVLTTEERAFFARMGTGGPLTYGRQATPAGPQAPMVRGGRLDVRA